MKKINAGNLFAGMRSSSVIAGLFIVLIVSIVLLFANFAYLNTQSNHDKQYIGHAGELRVLSQRIAKNATEAAAGKGEAFKLLKDARNDFEKRWNILVNGDESTSLPPSPEAVKPQMDVVQQDWDGLRKNADSILASEQTVLSLHQVASTLAETIPQLQVEYEEVVDILLENGAPADQVAVAQRQSLLAERILGSVNKVLAGDENSVQAADSFGRDASLFGRVLKGMQEGNAAMSISKVTNAEAVDRLNEIAELFEFVSGSVDEILETSPDLFQVREAANNIFSVSQTLLDKASQLADGFENLAGGRSINLFAGYALGALALASIILIGLVMVRETNRRLAETRREERPQPGRDPASARRDRRPRGRRPDRGRDRDRGFHRRHRRLDQLLHRPAPRTGGDHQPDRRAGGRSGPGNPVHRDAPGRSLRAPGAGNRRRLGGDQRNGGVDRPGIGERLGIPRR